MNKYCNTPSTPGPTVLTTDNPLGSYIIHTDQHESFMRTITLLHISSLIIRLIQHHVG
jgi:hypothetical protein